MIKKIFQIIIASLVFLSFLTGCSPTEEPIDPAKQQEEEQKKKEQEEKEKKEKEEQERKKQEEEQRKKEEEQKEKERQKLKAASETAITVTFKYVDIDNNQSICQDFVYPTFQYVYDVDKNFIDLYKGTITINDDVYVMAERSRYGLFSYDHSEDCHILYLEEVENPVITIYYKKFSVPEKYKDIIGKWYASEDFAESSYNDSGVSNGQGYNGSGSANYYYFDGDDIVFYEIPMWHFFEDKPITKYRETIVDLKDGVLRLKFEDRISVYYRFDKYCEPSDSAKDEKYKWLWNDSFGQQAFSDGKSTLIFYKPGGIIPKYYLAECYQGSNYVSCSYSIADQYVTISYFYSDGLQKVKYAYTYKDGKLTLTDPNNNVTVYQPTN